MRRSCNPDGGEAVGSAMKAESLYLQGCAALDEDPRRAAKLFAAALAENRDHRGARQGALLSSALLPENKEKRHEMLERAMRDNANPDLSRRAEQELKAMKSLQPTEPTDSSAESPSAAGGSPLAAPDAVQDHVEPAGAPLDSPPLMPIFQLRSPSRQGVARFFQ